jgi:uncharacterized protein
VDSASPENPNVESPCTGVCRLGTEQFCIGCGRTLGEITEWPTAPAEGRAKIRQAAAMRLRTLDHPFQQ